MHRRKQDIGALGDGELDRLADQLGEAVRKQWERAAGEQGIEPEPIPVQWGPPSEAMAGPVDAAIGSTRFAPLPGLRPINPQDLRNGNISNLHSLYGGLGSGRLVIAGAPGSGKTGAAVLLVLASLRHRELVPKEERDKVPVPVMFTLHGWDPDSQPLQAWLAAHLKLDYYPLFEGRGGALKAINLVSKGMVSVILDGLDEIPEVLRPVALEALSRQANFRVVLLSRSAEIAAAAACYFLDGAAAVELQDVDPETAAAYLTRIQRSPPPRSWQELICQLRRNPPSPIARALNSPLMLTLVRDTYRSGDDVRELLELSGTADCPDYSEDIAGHLLDRVLPAAYRRKPGEPPLRYSLQRAQTTLRRIAERMNEGNTRDLLWWRIAIWTATSVSTIATGFIFGILGALLVWIPVSAVDGVIAGTSYGIPTGFFIGFLALCAAMLGSKKRDKPPRRLVRIRWRRLIGLRPILGGIFVGIAVVGMANPGWMAELVERMGGEAPTFNTPWKVSTMAVAVGALLAGITAGLAFGFIRGVSYPGPENASPQTPLTAWRGDQIFSVVRGMIGGLMLGVTFGFLLGVVGGPIIGLVSAPIYASIFGLLGGLVVGPVTSNAWTASLAFGQLTVHWRSPLRLMRFLEDAHQRGILRTVGPVYQFRHARLQDRLAGQSAPQRRPVIFTRARSSYRSPPSTSSSEKGS
jgi:hypothetical protein